MFSNGLDQVKWFSYRQAEKLGVIGLLAILLMLAALFIYLALMLPAKESLLASNSLTTKQNKVSTSPESDLQAQIKAFTEALPVQAQKTDQIEQIIAIAKAQALELSAVNYQSKQEHNLIKTDMKFSVQSDYPKLKGFINDVLYRFSNASIKTLNIQRLKRESALVRSNIHLTLYFSQN